MDDDRDILEAMDLLDSGYSFAMMDFAEDIERIEKKNYMESNRKNEDPVVQAGEDCPYCLTTGSVRANTVIVGNVVQEYKECRHCHREI